jgi:hypothetical protein
MPVGQMVKFSDGTHADPQREIGSYRTVGLGAARIAQVCDVGLGILSQRVLSGLSLRFVAISRLRRRRRWPPTRCGAWIRPAWLMARRRGGDIDKRHHAALPPSTVPSPRRRGRGTWS